MIDPTRIGQNQRITHTKPRPKRPRRNRAAAPRDDFDRFCVEQKKRLAVKLSDNARRVKEENDAAFEMIWEHRK